MNQQEPDTKKEYLYDSIADQLEKDIISGEFPGGKLPSEQNIAVRYNVSRTVVREALKILGERHLVSTMAGSGAHITKPDANDLSVVVNRLISTHEIDYTNAFDVRIILETAAARSAALVITEEELRDLEELTDKMYDPATPVNDWNELDFQFHMMLAKASHNPLLELFIEAMGNTIFNTITLSIAGDHIGTVMHGSGGGLIDHRKIIRTLREHDPVAAEHIVYDHLYNSKMFYEDYVAEQEAAAENGQQEAAASAHAKE